MNTPGVYTVEDNAFPTSVVAVATAVPVFIGYTQRAVNGVKALTNVPWRIGSMVDYSHCFGGPPKPCFSIAEVGNPAPAAGPAPKPTDARGQSIAFSLSGRQYLLSRAAGKAGGRFLMHQSLNHFFQNGGSACYIVSVGNYGDEVDADALVAGLEPLLQEQEPTMVLTPDAVLLDEPGCIRVQRQVLAHCGGTMRNRVAILDIWGGDRDRRDGTYDCIEGFRGDLGTDHLDFAAAYYPWLHTSLVQAGDIDVTVFGDPSALASLLKTDVALGGSPGPADWPAPQRQPLHKRLMSVSPLYARLVEEACAQMNLVPPAAAMAGIYAQVDDARGVWKAPANVSVTNVIGPAVDVSHDDQEDLNVPIDGKSINVIRRFQGQGVLVWGARTLDGNSQDWRYISVRRTVIMLEESCRLAARTMVFEPNESRTWVTLRSMISNFLTGLWKSGGLVGAKPQDAFGVRVGLGETMTAQEIQEGILRVIVMVAIIRPAEFIAITFQQQMPKP